MSPLPGLALFIAATIAIEGVVRVAHRRMMCGPGRGRLLNASYHDPRVGWWPECPSIGAGIATYGTICHGLRHAARGRRGVVSFGFLRAPVPVVLNAVLRRRHEPAR